MNFIMDKISLVVDEIYGYKRIDPIPSKEELNNFYNKKYYEIMKARNNGSIDKLLSENEKKKNELTWLRETYFLDALNIFNKYI